MKKFNAHQDQASSASEDSRQHETIIIKKKVNNFVQLDKGFIEDIGLSFKAKGILSYLLSKPDGWKVIVQDLVNHSTDGKHAVYSGLNELKEQGYYHKYPVRDGQRIVRWESIVYECPADHQDEINKIKKEKNHKKNSKKKVEKKSEKPMEKPQDSLFTNFQDIESQDIESQNIENRQRSNIYLYQEQSYQHGISINISEPKFEELAETPASAKNDLIDRYNHPDIVKDAVIKPPSGNTETTPIKPTPPPTPILSPPIFSFLTPQEIADNISLSERKDQHPDNHKEIDLLYNLLCEVLTENIPIKPTIRISGQNMPIDQVREVFVNIGKEHIDYIVHSLNNNNNKNKIKTNTKSYLATALFHAPRTIDYYYYSSLQTPKPESNFNMKDFNDKIKRNAAKLLNP